MYCLLLWVRRPHWIRLSRMGTCRLERGWYVYTGSAKRGLLPRLERHLRREKRFHWHIDYLRDAASVRQIWIWPWTPAGECQTNARVRLLPNASVPFKRFGASDCRCDAHLISFPSDAAPLDLGAPFIYHVRRNRVARVEVKR